MLRNALAVFASLVVLGMGAPSAAQHTVHVYQDCTGIASPCFSDIQSAVTFVEVGTPDAGRTVFVHPGSTSAGAASYPGDVNCGVDADSGFTAIEGLAAPQQSNFLFPLFRPADRSGVWIQGDVELDANCGIANVNIEGTVTFAPSEGDIGYAYLRNATVLGMGALLGANERIISIKNQDGFVILDTVEAIGVCAGANANSALLHIDNPTGGDNPRTRWEGGKISIESPDDGCVDGAAAIEVASSYPETAFIGLSLSCETDGNSKPNCIEMADDGAHLLAHIMRAEQLVGPNQGLYQGRLFQIKDDGDETTNSTLHLSFQGADADVFAHPVDAPAAWASGTNQFGFVAWTGSFGGVAPDPTKGAGKCFPGWIATDYTPTGDALWVCNAGGGPGQAGTWVQ